jgi:hypothetical protein
MIGCIVMDDEQEPLAAGAAIVEKRMLE